MAKVKRKSQARYPAIVKENGLQDSWETGRLEIVEEQSQDNPKQKVTRIRIKSAYDEMFSRGTITKEQRDCAERYAILCEKACGATQDLYAKVSLLSVNRNQWEPTQAQHVAYELLFYLWKNVGKYHIDILNMVIFGNMSCKQIAENKRCLYQYVIGQVMSAFILLEETFKELDNVIKR